MMTDGSAPDPRAASAGAAPEDRSLLIVDDDAAFLGRLARAMESRGYTVRTAAIRRGRPEGDRDLRRRHSP